MENSYETYTSVYPARAFWAGSAIDLPAAIQANTFTEQMREVVYEKKNSDITLKICRDGEILLRINKLETIESDEHGRSMDEISASWSTYLNHLNCFYLLLDSSTLESDNLALFNLHEITTRDASRITLNNGKFISSSIAVESVAGSFQMGRYLHNYSSIETIEYDSKFSHRRVVRLETLDLAGEKYFAAISKPGAEKHLSSYAKSLAEYKVGNYETAIILSWFIIESITNYLWTTHIDSLNSEIDGGEKRISSDRKNMLQRYNADITSNILELFGVLELRDYKDMEKTRAKRNKIAHGGHYSPTSQDAVVALKLANKMIQKRWEIDFTPNLGYSIIHIP